MLFRAIKFELSRAFRDKYFVISLLIGGIIVTLDIVTFYTQYIEPKKMLVLFKHGLEQILHSHIIACTTFYCQS